MTPNDCLDSRNQRLWLWQVSCSGVSPWSESNDNYILTVRNDQDNLRWIMGDINQEMLIDAFILFVWNQISLRIMKYSIAKKYHSISRYEFYSHNISQRLPHSPKQRTIFSPCNNLKWFNLHALAHGKLHTAYTIYGLMVPWSRLEFLKNNEKV